jgi:Ca2+-binding RTX toxin-like protein
VAENTTAVVDVEAADPEVPPQSLTFSIAGGADAARFTIHGASGVLSFASPPNFESPADVGGDNVYDVVVRVSDGNLSDTQTIAVSVTDVNEVPDNGSGFDLSVPNRALIVADPANPGNKVLLAIGGGGGDALIMEPRPRNRVQIRVKQSGQLLGIFPSSAFGRIVVFGMAGNDTIVIDGRITKSVELHGGSGEDYLFGGAGRDSLFGEDGNDRLYGGKGNDKLFGGSGSDSLYGGAGNDALQGELGNDSLFGEAGHDLLLGGFGDDGLFGGSGRDILIGDRGADRLLGQNDDDVLVGGATIYENNDAALGAILAEWTSRRPFGARVNSMAALLNSSSVIDDGARDELRGEGGRDWLLDFALSDSIVGFNSRLTSGDRKN